MSKIFFEFRRQTCFLNVSWDSNTFWFFYGGYIKILGGLKKNFLSKIEISFFQNVELGELITNHPSCNYPTCTVTEIFESLFSLCIAFLWGVKNFFCPKSKFLFFKMKSSTSWSRITAFVTIHHVPLLRYSSRYFRYV